MKKKIEESLKRKKRRKAGDLSGPQLPLKRFERSGSQVLHLEMPPPAIKMVAAMREELLHFTDGEQDIFSDEEASPMRVYIAKKIGVSSTVSSHKPFFKLNSKAPA